MNNTIEKTLELYYKTAADTTPVEGMMGTSVTNPHISATLDRLNATQPQYKIKATATVPNIKAAKPANITALTETYFNQPGRIKELLFIDNETTNIAHLRRGRDGHGTITVYGPDTETTQKTVTRLQTELKEQTDTGNKDTIKIGLHMPQTHGGTYYTESVMRRPEHNLETGYTPATRELVQQLIDYDYDNLNDKTGRLIILQGKPGTGKTTALKIIASQTERKLSLQYVVDAQKPLNSATELTELITGIEGISNPDYLEHDNLPAWRYLVFEDADVILKRRTTGEIHPGTSALLNATDGIVSTLTNTLIVVTTNLETQDINPAFLRPGRCLANIKFHMFTKKEAEKTFGPQTAEKAWAQQPNQNTKLPIAEILSDNPILTTANTETQTPGQYL